jgi:hypothetical protein
VRYCCADKDDAFDASDDTRVLAMRDEEFEIDENGENERLGGNSGRDDASGASRWSCRFVSACINSMVLGDV